METAGHPSKGCRESLRKPVVRVDSEGQTSHTTLFGIELVSMGRVGQQASALWGRGGRIDLIDHDQQPLAVKATTQRFNRLRGLLGSSHGVAPTRNRVTVRLA